MAITAQIQQARTLVQAYVENYCANVADPAIPAAMIPFVDAVSQYDFSKVALPAFAIETDNVEVSEGPCAFDLTFKVPFCIHRIALRANGGSALAGIVTVICGLAAALAQDHTMAGNVTKVSIGKVEAGEMSRLQQIWKMNNLNNSVVAVSLPITLEWTESRL